MEKLLQAYEYMRKGLSEFRKKRYITAFDLVSNSLELHKEIAISGKNSHMDDLAGAYMNRGVMARYINNYDKAFEDYKEAIKIWKDLMDKNYFASFSTLLTCYRNLIILSSGTEKYGDQAKKTSEEVISLIKDIINSNRTEEKIHILNSDIIDIIMRFGFLDREAEECVEKVAEDFVITVDPGLDHMDIMGEIAAGFARNSSYFYICQIADKGLENLVEKEKYEDALWLSQFWLQAMEQMNYPKHRKEKIENLMKELKKKVELL